MRPIDLSFPELAFVAATRGMLGVGLGLLASNYLEPETRRSVGWTFFAIGALTTLPIAATLIGRGRTPIPAD